MILSIATYARYIFFFQIQIYSYRKSPTSSAIPITPPSHTRSNTWFPLNFSMEIDENSELKIESSNSSDTIVSSPTTTTTSDQLTPDNSNDLPQPDDVDTVENDEPIQATTTAGKINSTQKDYKLTAVVCEINDSNQKHLVALVYVGESYHQMKLGDTSNRSGQWYIFNDFSIAPVSLQEAVWFTLDWKQPCVLFYSCCDFPPADTEVALDQFVNPFVHVSGNELKISTDFDLTLNGIIFVFQDIFSQQICKNKRYDMNFKPLSTAEMPGRGDLVAMDAEFVTLNPEENEIRPDGKTATIKPSHMSVARITCIRG